MAIMFLILQELMPSLNSQLLSTVGVNVPDHDMTFQSLSDLLQQSVTPHVASVQAKECAGEGLIPQYSKRICSLKYTLVFSALFLFDHFSIEAFDEECPGETDGHSSCCG